jgi:hypothetical protein
VKFKNRDTFLEISKWNPEKQLENLNKIDLIKRVFEYHTTVDPN